MRQHAARRVRHVHPEVRQGRFRPQRPRTVSVLLRHGHTQPGRGPVRPGAHVQRVPSGLGGARRYVDHIVLDADTVPENGRSGRRRQNAVQTQVDEDPAVPSERSRTGQHRDTKLVPDGSGQHVPLRFAT